MNKTQTEYIALNQVGAEQNEMPIWIEIFPVGYIKGRDGREWQLPNPQGLIDAFIGEGQFIPIDFEHGLELKKTTSENPKIAGWVEELKIIGGSLWGRVSWCNSGRYALEDKQYRYISPAFYYKASTKEITKITSIALTNQPNLKLTALCEQQAEESMKKALCKALNLSEEVTDEEVIKKVEEVALCNRDSTDISKSVPATEYEHMKKRAICAEEENQAIKDGVLQNSINTKVDEAVKAGKIAPASREHFIAMGTAGGVDAFDKFVETAPSITAASSLKEEDIPKASNSLSQIEKDMCKSMCVTEEEFLKTREGK